MNRQQRITTRIALAAALGYLLAFVTQVILQAVGA